MSVTVSAVPFSLIFSLAANSFAESVNNSIVAGLKSGNEKLHLELDDVETKLINKTFNTTIMDENVLIKTLKEHGASDIKTTNNSAIECNCQYFHLSFRKENADLPYNMTVVANENNGIEVFADDIKNEYTLNVQEISYKKIKERLEAQNLKVSNEEIYDDNTIVLTVNLEE